MNWQTFRGVVDSIVALVGEAELESVDCCEFSRYIRVSPKAFCRLSVGRTVEQKNTGAFLTRWFVLTNGTEVRTMLAIPKAVIQSSIVPGEPIDFDRPIAAEAALGDEDHADDDTAILTEAEAKEVLGQHTVCEKAVTHG